MNKNIDHDELQKFADLAEKWWDRSGEFKPLHVINPIRANYISSKVDLPDLNVLDVGCGGGLLTEALFDFGAKVTGIDVAGPGIEIAKMHAEKSNKPINYEVAIAEDFSKEHTNRFDVVTCLEVVEHVPDPGSLIQACSTMLKKDGLLFLSTINRNPRSWITAIVGAEYIFKILPKGTHEFEKFIKPSELAEFMEQASIKLLEAKGLFYNPISHQANLNNDLGVNYMVYGINEAN